MAISESYRRGYRAAREDAANIAFQRKIECEAARDRYAKENPGEPYWSRSEACAATEATHIWSHILALMPKAK